MQILQPILSMSFFALLAQHGAENGFLMRTSSPHYTKGDSTIATSIHQVRVSGRISRLPLSPTRALQLGSEHPQAARHFVRHVAANGTASKAPKEMDEKK